MKKTRKIIPYKSNLKTLARELRKKSTQSEIILWKILKGKKMHGYQFMRQKPLLSFIADFYSPELELIIELDGYSHNFEEVQKKDENKEKMLSRYSLKTLRFSDYQVLNDLNNVVRAIEAYIEEYEEK
jgi:very-short-patch-repair endonuclease